MIGIMSPRNKKELTEWYALNQLLVILIEFAECKTFPQ